MKVLTQMKPLRLKGPMPEKQAAVLVPLCFVKGELSLLYTVRSTNLRTNRGEVSFPGGMQDKEDESLVQTALRETEEELGINANEVEVWGEANFVGTYSGKVAVLPIIGFIGDVEVANLKTNPEEVEAVFTMSLQQLCDPNVCRHTQFRTRSLVLPLFVSPEYKVWGLTAVITHVFLKALIPDQYTKKLRILPLVQPKK
ncbi:hypothetical protein B566_EDAN002536 [Ephemera danica]|nr:hypothetical protein B566_EDAN002536 [Ephemera danica]